MRDLKSISSALEGNPSRIGEGAYLTPGQSLVASSTGRLLRFGLEVPDPLLVSYLDTIFLKLEPGPLDQNQPGSG